MNLRPTLARQVAALSCTALLLASCSSSSEQEKLGEYRLTEEIAYLHLPTEPSDPFLIQATDFLRVAEILDKPWFESDAPADEVADWFNSVSTPLDADAKVTVILPDSFGWSVHLSQTESIDAGLGYSIRDVERFTEINTPPGVNFVAQGSFDQSGVTTALGDPVDGIWSFGDGYEINIDARDVSPPLGQGISIGRVDGRTILGRVTETAESAKDTERSVANEQSILEAARGLDSQGTWYSAIIMRGQPLESGLPTGLDAPDGVLLQPFMHIGVALDRVDDENLLYLSYSHGSPEAAETNEALLPETLAWISENMPGALGFDGSLSIAETNVDGTLVTATLQISDDFHIVRAWPSVFSPHPLFFHG